MLLEPTIPKGVYLRKGIVYKVDIGKSVGGALWKTNIGVKHTCIECKASKEPPWVYELFVKT
jgi:hypothetical protein